MTSELITSAMTVLNSERAVATSGFMLGFLYDFKFNAQTLQNPLTTILNASIAGFITSIGAAIVGGFVPEELRFLIPLSAVASCIYYKYNDLKESKSCDKCRCKPLTGLSRCDGNADKYNK